MPARFCQLARVWEVNAAESNVPWSNSMSSCMGVIAAMVMLLIVRTALGRRLPTCSPGDEYSPCRSTYQERGSKNIMCFLVPDGIPNGIPATLFDVHSGNEGITNFIGVADHLIDQKFAFAVMNYLVNFHDPSASVIGIYAYRFDVRIEESPLPGPVFAHALVPIDEAAFHSVRPDDIGLHSRQYRVEPAGIEITVGTTKEFTFIGHGGSPLSWFKGGAPIDFAAGAAIIRGGRGSSGRCQEDCDSVRHNPFHSR